jgi:hypothetical protein
MMDLRDGKDTLIFSDDSAGALFRIVKRCLPLERPVRALAITATFRSAKQGFDDVVMAGN